MTLLADVCQQGSEARYLPGDFTKRTATRSYPVLHRRNRINPSDVFRLELIVSCHKVGIGGFCQGPPVICQVLE